MTPALIRAAEALGEKVWDRAGSAAVDEGIRFGRLLLDKLLRQAGPGASPGRGWQDGPASAAQVAVVTAVNDVVAAPADPDVQASLRLAVRKLLEADPGLMASVAQLAGPKSQRMGRYGRSVMLGGAQSGGINIVGDNNVVHQGWSPASTARGQG